MYGTGLTRVIATDCDGKVGDSSLFPFEADNQACWIHFMWILYSRVGAVKPDEPVAQRSEPERVEFDHFIAFDRRYPLPEKIVVK